RIRSHSRARGPGLLRIAFEPQQRFRAIVRCTRALREGSRAYRFLSALATVLRLCPAVRVAGAILQCAESNANGRAGLLVVPNNSEWLFQTRLCRNNVAPIARFGMPQQAEKTK